MKYPKPSKLNLCKSRRPRNEAERKFYDLVIKKGWKPVRRGWPDFICFNPKDNSVVFVEVKPRKISYPKASQMVIMTLLANAGLRCFLWNPDTGFKKIKPDVIPPQTPLGTLELE